MASSTEIMAINNNSTILNNNSNNNSTNSTDNKSNNENVQSKFAVHVRHDKRKKFFTRATSAKITVKEFFDFIKTAYQVNESLEQLSDVINNENGDINGSSNRNVNWTKLANNQLINQLITIEQQQQQFQELNKKENECKTNENQQIDATTNQNNKTKLKQSQLSIVKSSESTTTTTTVSTSLASPQQTNQNQTTEIKQSSISMLHEMMDEIICEGILDKVLPYLTPTDLQLTATMTINNSNNNNVTQPIIKKQQTLVGTSTTGDHKKINKHGTKDSKTNQQSTSAGQSHQSTSKTSLSKGSNDKTTYQSGSTKKDDNQIVSANNNVNGNKSTLSAVTEPEVEIHVCDEVKHLKKDFRCPQSLLISKMGYFAEITAGQRLEDIDISVHCDIGIFDWLMRWTKKDLLPQDQWPQLESQCVAPILVSAVFLQMDPLIEDCLLYCHQHMNEVLKTNTNLSCLNDVIITRLAAMYTNTELELIKDKKDKIISRLYCKLILSLGEPVAQSIRGHWSTLAGIYKCSKCLKLIINSTTNIASEIQCIPSQMYVSLNGNIINQHERDLNWNLSEYIIHLYHELKTWRKVYWRLWSVCHYLRCQTCLTLFPVHQMSWCCSHTEQPQFFIIENQQQQQTTIPVGRYACCGARTYRFEILTNTSQGCIFKEHIPDVKHPRDAAILTIFNQHRHVIEQSPPQIMIPERLTKLVARDATNNDCMKLFNNKEILWWEGIELAPTRQKLGLLGKMCFVGRTTASKLHQTSSNHQQNDNDSSSSEYSSSDDDDDDNEYNPYDDDSESLTSDANGGAGRITTTAGAGIDHNIHGSLIDDNEMSSTSSNDDDDDNDNTDNDQRVQPVNRAELSLNIFNTNNTMNKTNRYHDTTKRTKRRHRRHKHHRSSHHHGSHHHRHGQNSRNKDNSNNMGRYWSPTLSARSNQDLQRDFEETAMQQITDFLSRRTAGVTSTVLNNNGNINHISTSTACSNNNAGSGGFDLTTSNKNNYYSITSNNNIIQQKQSINNKIQYANVWNHHIIPTGGIYQRLEAEWNELYRQQSQQSYHQTNKHNKSSTSYIAKPKFKVHRNNNNNNTN